MRVTTDKRDRLVDEIVPISAPNAVDLDLETWSSAQTDDDGAWLKLTLSRVSCVQHVVWYDLDGSSYLSWTCANADCSDCQGGDCSIFLLTVFSEGAAVDHLPLVPDCKYGDTVKLATSNWPNGFNVREMAIREKQGDNMLASYIWALFNVVRQSTFN